MPQILVVFCVPGIGDIAENKTVMVFVLMEFRVYRGHERANKELITQWNLFSMPIWLCPSGYKSFSGFISLQNKVEDPLTWTSLWGLVSACLSKLISPYTSILLTVNTELLVAPCSSLSCLFAATRAAFLPEVFFSFACLTGFHPALANPKSGIIVFETIWVGFYPLEMSYKHFRMVSLQRWHGRIIWGQMPDKEFSSCSVFSSLSSICYLCPHIIEPRTD